MKDDDDTRTPTGSLLAELVPGHGIARLDDGRLAHVIDPAVHPKCAEASGGSAVLLRRRERRQGPARVNTDAYRQGYDRIFGRPVGDES